MILLILKYTTPFSADGYSIYDKIPIPEGLIEDYHYDALTEAEFEDELQKMFDNYIEKNHLKSSMFCWEYNEEEYYL